LNGYQRRNQGLRGRARRVLAPPSREAARATEPMKGSVGQLGQVRGAPDTRDWGTRQDSPRGHFRTPANFPVARQQAQANLETKPWGAHANLKTRPGSAHANRETDCLNVPANPSVDAFPTQVRLWRAPVLLRANLRVGGLDLTGSPQKAWRYLHTLGDRVCRYLEGRNGSTTRTTPVAESATDPARLAVIRRKNQSG